MITEGELVYICMLVNLAIIECHFESRPFCIFNHPQYPNDRFEIGGFITLRRYEAPPLSASDIAWPAPVDASRHLH